jgi:hypothetical protein
MNAANMVHCNGRIRVTELALSLLASWCSIWSKWSVQPFIPLGLSWVLLQRTRPTTRFTMISRLGYCSHPKTMGLKVYFWLLVLLHGTPSSAATLSAADMPDCAVCLACRDDSND